jgi:hypothetical protein
VYAPLHARLATLAFLIKLVTSPTWSDLQSLLALAFGWSLPGSICVEWLAESDSPNKTFSKRIIATSCKGLFYFGIFCFFTTTSLAQATISLIIVKFMSAARCTAVWKRRPLKSCTLRTWTQWETINHAAFDQLFLLIGQLRALWIRRTTTSSSQPWSITRMVLIKILLYNFWRTQLSFHPYVCSCIWLSIRYICLVWLWRFKGRTTCSSLFLRI